MDRHVRVNAEDSKGRARVESCRRVSRLTKYLKNPENLPANDGWDYKTIQCFLEAALIRKDSRPKPKNPGPL